MGSRAAVVAGKRKGYSCNLYAPTQIAAARLAAKEFHITLSDMKLHQRIKPTKKKTGRANTSLCTMTKEINVGRSGGVDFPPKAALKHNLLQLSLQQHWSVRH